MKKALSLILALLLVLAVFAGCAADTQESSESSKASESSKSSESSKAEESEEELFTPVGTFPIANETISIHGAMPDNARTPWNDNLQKQWMLDLTNIDVTMDVYASDAWQEKLGVLLAGGDYPDFFYMCEMGKDKQTLYGSDSGYLLDLKPYIESGVMPNFKSFTDADGDIYRIACVPDGGLYALPWLANGLNEPCWGINGAWMERLGLEQPTTIEELTDIFRAFRDEDANGDGDPNNEIPFTSCYSLYWLPMYPMFGLVSTGLYEADANHTVAHAATTQNFKDYLAWLNLCFDEGLLDERCPGSVINDENILSDIMAGLTGCVYTANYAGLGETKEEYVGLNIVPYGDNTTGVWPAAGILVQGTFAVTDKCEYPEAILRFIDYYYSDEGQVLYNYGIENETFKINDDNSWSWILPDGVEEADFANSLTIQGNHYYPGIYSPWGQEHSNDPCVKAILKARADLVPITKKIIADYSLTQEETDEISVISNDITSYVDTCMVKFVIGEMSLDKDWDEFQSTLTAMGLETYLSVVQGAVDRFYA